MALLQPGAAYFGTDGGTRISYMFFHSDDPAMIPLIAEPLFQERQSQVRAVPVMNADDLQRGLANVARNNQ